MKIFRLFSTDEVQVLDYPNHKELKNEILSRVESSPDFMNKRTNVKATMTDWNITSPEIEKLKLYIGEAIHNYLLSVNITNVKVVDLNFRDFWGNIYRKGEYTVPHDHFPSTFSIVYFLKGKKHFSPLVFNRFSKIRCKEGRLVIFPSYLKHWVPVHKHSETRITLSSNINLA